LLEQPFIAAMRRNHALEHATIHILTWRYPHLHFVGRTTPKGFHIYGAVEMEAVAAAASEALARLQAGERELALHPRCGTNLAVAGILAGLSSFVAMGRKPRLSKLPQVILVATAALVAAQPLGMMVQEFVTTSSQLADVKIERVTRQTMSNMVVHKVEVGSNEKSLQK